VNLALSQDKKKTLLEYTKPNTQSKKNAVDEIIEWFIEEKKKKGEGSEARST
jgi:hypothetical protein